MRENRRIDFSHYRLQLVLIIHQTFHLSNATTPNLHLNFGFLLEANLRSLSSQQPQLLRSSRTSRWHSDPLQNPASPHPPRICHPFHSCLTTPGSVWTYVAQGLYRPCHRPKEWRICCSSTWIRVVSALLRCLAHKWRMHDPNGEHFCRSQGYRGGTRCAHRRSGEGRWWEKFEACWVNASLVC